MAYLFPFYETLDYFLEAFFGASSSLLLSASLSESELGSLTLLYFLELVFEAVLLGTFLAAGFFLVASSLSDESSSLLSAFFYSFFGYFAITLTSSSDSSLLLSALAAFFAGAAFFATAAFGTTFSSSEESLSDESSFLTTALLFFLAYFPVAFPDALVYEAALALFSPTAGFFLASASESSESSES